MIFDEAVWDDSKPEYAPCRKPVRNVFYWAAPKKYLKAGFTLKTVRLEGTKGDGHDLERAAHCRSLTREMLEWYEGKTGGKTPGTWGWLISRYLTDTDSDIWDVRPSTRDSYRYEIVKIEKAIANVTLSDTDFPRMKKWQRLMTEKGRSAHYIKSFFTHISLLLSYGIKLEDPDCARIKAIRGEMRIKSAPRRAVYITREQVEQVVDRADAIHKPHISLALLLRFELILRGVDVYGQWVTAEDAKGGIQHHGKRWVDGITWDGISKDAATIEHQISKTRDSMPEPYLFDLTHLPDIRRRILATPPDKRTGPLIVDHTGLPPKKGMISKGFKAIVRDLGLPEKLQMRDGRAGGVTEAKSMVDPRTLQHAAQHQNLNTTDRYARDRSTSANEVIQLRAKR